MGKAGKETVVVQILAAERPLNHRILTTPEVVQCFGPRFRSQEAVGDPHFLHKKGTHAITGPDWLKKKWVSDRIDDAGFMMHWTDMTDDFDDLDDFDEFEPFMFQDLLDHHMMGLHDYLYMDHDLGWDVWDEYYHDFPRLFVRHDLCEVRLGIWDHEVAKNFLFPLFFYLYSRLYSSEGWSMGFGWPGTGRRYGKN